MTPNHQSGASTRVYGQPSTAGNTNQGSGVARDKPKGKKRYRWPNGSIHSRPYRGHGGGNAGGGGNGGGGGGQPPAPAPSKHPYLDQANQQADLVYGPAISAIRQDQANVTPYFDAYRAQVAAASQNYTSQSAAPLAQAQQLQQTAGTVAQGAENDPEAQLAAQSRAALTGLGLTALQGIVNANQGYFAGQQGPVAAAGEVGLKTNLNREMRDTQTQRGGYVAKTRQDLKDTAHKSRLEDAAFGLNVDKANVDAANTAADNRRANRQDRQDRRDKQNEVITSGPFAGFTKKEVRQMDPAKKAKLRTKASAGSGASGSGFTPTQVSKSQVQLRKGVSAIRRALEGKQYAPTDFWKKAYNDLLDAGYDPLMARAAIQVVRRGGVGPNVKKRLQQDYGLTHTPRGKPTKKPPAFVLKPAPQTPGPNSEYRPT